MATTTHAGRKALPTTFTGLNMLLPLRPIHDRVGLENAAEVVDRLALLLEPTEDQAEYLESLSTLIEAYEADERNALADKASPVESLRYLMDANDMNASDLGRLLGERSLGPKVLSGSRGLSQAHIRKLCERFKVTADLFI